jgi:hypothetical protein
VGNVATVRRQRTFSGAGAKCNLSEILRPDVRNGRLMWQLIEENRIERRVKGVWKNRESGDMGLSLHLNSIISEMTKPCYEIIP